MPNRDSESHLLFAIRSGRAITKNDKTKPIAGKAVGGS